VYLPPLIADWTGSELALLGNVVAPMIASLGSVMNSIGSTLPVWGPKVSALFAGVQRSQDYRKLHPLWFALYRTVPQIALDPPRDPERNRWALRDLRFLLIRRIVEIYDGRLALRPRLDRRVAEAARAAGERSGLDGQALEAVVEACVLAAAIRRPDPVPEEWALEPREAPVDGDTTAEQAFLVEVATAFKESSLVRQVVLGSRIVPDRV